MPSVRRGALFGDKLFYVAALLATLAASAAHGANVETLLMPGKLTESHAEFEETCDNCHEKFRKGGQGERCLACHDHADIDKDIKKRSGFHGRLDAQRVAACQNCHTEHKGRDADIVGLNRASFDHRLTDFELLGSHTDVACDGCHKKEEKFSAAPSECVRCHEQDDAHRGKLGEQCADCHKPAGWRETLFDHDKTEFPLAAKHREVQCPLCHVDHRYKDTPKECVQCHAVNDAHGGRYGKKCATCHKPERWERSHFDHDKETKFALRGLHAKAKCDTCHRGDLYRDKLKQTCISCHEHDDWHKGKNGSKCESCHDEEGWKETHFDHDRETKFKLDGAHGKLVCAACHKGERTEEKLQTECMSCHKVNDVHRGSAGPECEECHSTKKWNEVTFDHGKETAFALRGAHAKAECQKCHTFAAKEQRLSMACYDCHRADDVHQGQQGKRCGNCHNENGWAERVVFDHDLTRFPLIGQHATSTCEACHASNAYQDTARACVECHGEDDEHKRTLGTRCESCHNPNAWTAWIFDHDTQTDFKRDGAHSELTCRQCHTAPMQEKVNQSAGCYSCHRADDIHAGGFGVQCERCHTTTSFDELTMVR